MQRIAIARAILQGLGKPIFVWDEATSALDNITAQGVMKHFRDQEASKIAITFVLTFRYLHGT